MHPSSYGVQSHQCVAGAFVSRRSQRPDPHGREGQAGNMHVSAVPCALNPPPCIPPCVWFTATWRPQGMYGMALIDMAGSCTWGLLGHGWGVGWANGHDHAGSTRMLPLHPPICASLMSPT